MLAAYAAHAAYQPIARLQWKAAADLITRWGQPSTVSRPLFNSAAVNLVLFHFSLNSSYQSLESIYCFIYESFFYGSLISNGRCSLPVWPYSSKYGVLQKCCSHRVLIFSMSVFSARSKKTFVGVTDSTKFTVAYPSILLLPSLDDECTYIVIPIFSIYKNIHMCFT